jgi:energy-coupling factor transport system substrate-specific component
LCSHGAELNGMSAATVTRAPSRIPLNFVVVLVPAMAALNIVAGTIVAALKLPVFLDMTGTMVASVALGPWWGALTAMITNTAGSLTMGPTEIPFALCNVVGALVWGYGIRTFGMGRSFPRLLILAVVVGVLTQIMAAPIITFLFGGATGNSTDVLVAMFAAAGQSLFVASFLGGIASSIADKIISTFVGLAILRALPPGYTASVDLPEGDQTKTAMLVAGGLAVGLLAVLLTVYVIAPAVKSGS